MAGTGNALETPNPGRWRLIAGFVVLMALAAFIVVMWLVFQDDRTDGRISAGTGIPVVRAPDTPDRERPAEPGGAEVPDRDKSVFETFNTEEEARTETVERLLPPPEAPLDDDVPPERPEGDMETVIEVAKRPEPVPPPADTGADPTAASPVPVARPKAEPARTIADLVAGSTPKPATAPPASAAPGPATGDWQIQLAAFRDEPSAREAWTLIQKKFPNALKSLQPTIVRADLGDRGVYYRLRTGDFASKQAADSFCQTLADKGQGCISARR